MRTIFMLLLTPITTLGGIYSANEPCPFNIRPDGHALELSFNSDKSGRFKQELAKYELMLNPQRQSVDRDTVLIRIEKQRGEPTERAVDFLRVGQLDEALNTLLPLARQGDYRVLMNLAHVLATRGDFADALRRHTDARLDSELPKNSPGITTEQRTWLMRVEKLYYARWLLLRKESATKRILPEQEDVLALFPDVRFSSESGEYLAGNLSPLEKSKLPPDAIAIVQQLILWSPTDTQLLWLLAELYAADGRLREAEVLFDDCIWSRSFSNRKILMAHREAVRRAVAAMPVSPQGEAPLAQPRVDPPKREPTLEDIGLSETKLMMFGFVFGGLALLMLGLQIRVYRRRVRRE